MTYRQQLIDLLSYTDGMSIRECEQWMNVDRRILAGTITNARARAKNATFYIKSWVWQETGRRGQWVAKWGYGKASKYDAPRPENMTNAQRCARYERKLKQQTTAVTSVFDLARHL